MHQAYFSVKKDNGVECNLCYHNCFLRNGQTGICGVRKNNNGVLYSTNYGRLVAEHVDPIEKKPLFHFTPSNLSYSISTVGCNFRCRHCQNSSISQVAATEERGGHLEEQSAEQVVLKALGARCSSISYTYVEPTIFYEFALDCCVLAREKGVYNVFVSNGYMQKAPARRLAPVLDAINIDIKGFSESFYKKVAGGRLSPVLDTVSLMHELGVWVEVTTLIIPGLNDKPDELRELAKFIVSVDPNIPWHITAFHPAYKMMNWLPADMASLLAARAIGLEEGLYYVYLGNVSGHRSTYCPGCGTLLIDRSGYSGRVTGMADNKCRQCGYAIPGVWV